MDSKGACGKEPSMGEASDTYRTKTRGGNSVKGKVKNGGGEDSSQKYTKKIAKKKTRKSE